MDKSLLVDENNLLFRSYAMNQQRSFKGKHTGTTYMFVKLLLSYINKYQPTYVGICTDSPPYLRAIQMGEEYKGNRVINPVAKTLVDESRGYIKDILALLDIPVYKHQGFEADDIIANAIIHNPDMEHFIVSNDSDLYQLFEYDNVNIVSTLHKLITKKDFPKLTPNNINLTGVDPSDWPLILSMTGTHNGIKGIVGIGPKKAMEIYNNPELFNEIMAEHGEMLAEYYRLIHLPIEELPEFKLRKSKADYRRVVNYLIKELGFKIEPYMENGIQWLI